MLLVRRESRLSGRLCVLIIESSEQGENLLFAVTTVLPKVCAPFAASLFRASSSAPHIDRTRIKGAGPDGSRDDSQEQRENEGSIPARQFHH